MEDGQVRMSDVNYSMKEFILTKLLGKDEKPIFTDVAPTKLDKEGRFLLLTHKDRMEEAQEAIDKFVAFLTKSGQMSSLALPNQMIARTNRTQLGPRFAQHANKITARFSLSAAAPPAPPPTNNPWNSPNKRPVQMVIGCNNEFPPLETASPPQGTNETSKKQKQGTEPVTQSSTDDSQTDDLTTETFPTRNSEYDQRLKDQEDKTNKMIEDLQRENNRLREEHASDRRAANERHLNLATTMNELRKHLNDEARRTNDIAAQLDGVAKLTVFLATNLSKSLPGMPPLPQEFLQTIAPTEPARPSHTSDGTPMEVEQGEDTASGKRTAAEMH
jgi:hypothetical protein